MPVARTSKTPTLDAERALWRNGFEYVAGVDEVGRGSLAGPVVAAAVILGRGKQIEGVADSKTIPRKTREALDETIRAIALSIGIGLCSPEEIDRFNIHHASLEAMQRAIRNLSIGPAYLLIDGNEWLPHSEWPYGTIVQGDRLCHSIAAASIVAKVARDRLMQQLHDEHPAYAWNANAGYPTPGHYEALARHGPTPHHRRSFRLS